MNTVGTLLTEVTAVTEGTVVTGVTVTKVVTILTVMTHGTQIYLYVKIPEVSVVTDIIIVAIRSSDSSSSSEINYKSERQIIITI